MWTNIENGGHSVPTPLYLPISLVEPLKPLLSVSLKPYFLTSEIIKIPVFTKK